MVMPRVPWVVLAAAAVVALIGYQQWQISTLRRQLANPLLEPKLLERLEKVLARGEATPERPVTVMVSPPGATGPAQPVTVHVAPATTIPSLTPGGPPITVAPRVVADAPSVYCKTKAECDVIYARAPQAMTVDAHIRAGVMATVCADVATRTDQRLETSGCPHGMIRVSGPLADPIKFTAQFVLSERGIFQGLNVEGGPLEITRIRTETTINPVAPGPPPLPYHLGLVARTGQSSFTGLRYVNRTGPGLYEIEAGWGWPGFTGNIGIVIPIR